MSKMLHLVQKSKFFLNNLRLINFVTFLAGDYCSILLYLSRTHNICVATWDGSYSTQLNIWRPVQNAYIFADHMF